MANLASNLPVLNIPFVDANNNLSVPWLMFLVQMYQRTGGDQTPPLNLTQVQQTYLNSVNILSSNGFAGSIAYTTNTANVTLSTTVTGIVKGDGTALSAATSGTDYSLPVLVSSANGFAGTVVNGTSNATVTMKTTITGLLKGNGTAISAAISGTDYAPATSGTSILYGNGAGGFSNVTIGSGLSFTGGTLSATGSGGTITSVTGTAPISSSGGTTPNISITQSSATTSGYLSSTDWNTFNNKQPSGTYVTSVTATSPVLSSGGTTPNISMGAASSSTNGYLTSTDWTTFNNKGSGSVTSVALSLPSIFSVTGSPVTTSGTLTGTLTTQTANTVFAGPSTGSVANPTFRALVSADIPSLNYVTSVSGTSPISVTSGYTPTVSISQAGTSSNGYLSSTDWNTFNNKGSGTVTSITSSTLTIGGTSAIPTVNLTSGIVTAGTTGSSTLIPVITVDTYGRVTNVTTASNPQGTVTSVSGTGSVNGITLTGTVTSSGSLTLGGTLSGIANSQLTNSTISGISLGSNLASLTIGTGLSGTSYNGSTATTIAIANSGVTSGTYGSASVVPVITVNSQGQITSISTQATNAPSYQGTWNASTNTPTLTSSVGTAGYYYVVSVAGNTTLNGVSGWNVGDWAIFENSVWQKIPGSTSESFTNLTTTNLAVTGLTGYMYANNTTSNVTASTTIPTTALSGTITNAQLANSTISGVSLGSNLFSLTAGTGVSFSSGTTYNGSAAITINATGTGGTVTSVAATVPSFLSISGSPITTSGTLAISYSGTALPAVNGGTAQTSYTTGDILYASASNTLSKLAVGTTGYTLTVASGVPTWKPPYVRTSFTATASQTTFTANYNVGYVQVFVNGVLLNGADYTATNGTSVVLGVGCNAGDIVETIAYNV